VIAAALRSEVELQVEPTKQRGHATHIVAGAVHDGVDVVFSLGGDGTANEVIQALAGTGVLLGVIPGGGTNVLARALGLPNEPVAATSRLLAALREGRARSIGLGRANGRYFAFHAGYGFDAALVRRVEQHPVLKRVLRQVAFVLLGLRTWFSQRHYGRDPGIAVDLLDGPAPGRFGTCMIANGRPYTYLGERELLVHPHADFDRGLDVVTVGRISDLSMTALLLGAFAGGRHLRHRAVTEHRDLAGFTVTSTRPEPLQVDGDYAGEHTEVRFEAVPAALRVLA
jgi:diacylglycerol kinase family enzyme